MEYQEYRDTLNRIYSTVDGKAIIDHLENIYVYQSAFTKDTNTTMYVLGQKELMQDIVVNARTQFILTEEPNDE